LLQPVGLALAVALFWGSAARSQAAPARAKRERPVTVTGNPADPLPEIRVVADTPTVLLLPAPILKKTLKVDLSRIRVRDVGDSSIIVQAVENLRKDERHELEVFFADGKAPARAAFVLVTDPSEVDTRIDVERRTEPEPGRQTASEPCAPLSAADAVSSGWIDGFGVQTRKVESVTDAAAGFVSQQGMSYRARNWVLVDMVISRLPGHPAWRPSGATLKGKSGEVTVRAVKVEPDTASSENEVRVLVHTDVPPPSAGLKFTLHLHGAEGAPSFLIPKVELAPAKEDK